MPPDRMQHSKVGNLSFAAFLIIEARRKGMLSKKGKKNNISMIHCRLSSFPDFVPSKEREKKSLAVNDFTVQEPRCSSKIPGRRDGGLHEKDTRNEQKWQGDMAKCCQFVINGGVRGPPPARGRRGRCRCPPRRL